MERLHTHYDNLKVSRDAPVEVIRAAYTSLSQRHHPDCNSESDRELCIRRMKMISQAFDTLSDPAKRKQHDKWIKKEETLLNEVSLNATSQGVNKGAWIDVEAKEVISQNSQKNVAAWSSTGSVLLGVLAVLFFIFYSSFKKDDLHRSATSPLLGSTDSSLNQKLPLGVIPKAKKARAFDRSPNGNAWPGESGYLAGYPLLYQRGYSTIYVDNSNSTDAVFGKLVNLNGSPFPIRHFYIAASSTFTLENVSPGLYDLRFQNLSSGSKLKAESFNLEELPTDRGVEYSTISMTLYTVRNGNMKTQAISDEDFDLGE